MNPYFIILTVVPFVLMAIICAGMPIYRQKLIKSAGEKLIPLTKKNPWLSYVCSGIAFLLTVLSVMIDFGRLNFVIPACAVLGMFLSTRESTFLPVNGVYENLLIVGSEILFYKDIQSLPQAEYSSEETLRESDSVLVVITKKYGKKRLMFNNSNEVQETLKVLKQKCRLEE